MKYVTLLILSNGGREYVARAFEYWEDAQKTADEYNAIILKEGLRGLYYTKTLVVENR